MNSTDCPKTGLLTKIPYSLFVFYKIATFVPAFIGLYAIWIYAESLLWVFGYVLLFLMHIVIIFKRKCTHCSYYRLPGNTLQCMWLWGVPKFFKENPAPEGKLNKVYTPVGMSLVTFFPVYWLGNNWALLILYFASIAVLVLSLFLFTCSRCTYFGCSYNKVPEIKRNTYLNTH